MNLSSLRKKLAEAAPVAQPQQKPQSQQQVMPDRRLVRKAGVDYNKLVQAMRRLQRNPNPKLLPADLAQNYGKYMDASVNAATMAARSGGGRYFAESFRADPPMMLVLKRKGVRIFPDGKRVALYINEKLGLSFSVPYGDTGPQQKVIGIFEQFHKMSDEELIDYVKAGKQLHADLTKQGKHKEATDHILKVIDAQGEMISRKIEKINRSLREENIEEIMDVVYENLSEENQEEFEKLVSTPEGFEKVAEFSLAYLQLQQEIAEE